MSILLVWDKSEDKLGDSLVPETVFALGMNLDLYNGFNTGLVGFTVAHSMDKIPILQWLGNGFSQSFPRFTHKVDLDALVDELSNPLGKGCGSNYADHEVTNLS